jgi:hypothetical protein
MRTCPNASEARPMQLRYERVGRWEVNDIWESTSAKSLEYECEGRRPLSVIPGDGTEVRGWSTYEQGESVRGSPRP